MNEIFSGLLGNRQIKEHIGRDIKSGDRSHAYIIEGTAGSGKRTAAGLIASLILLFPYNALDSMVDDEEASDTAKKD